MSINVNYQEEFKNRHIAPDEPSTQDMLRAVGVKTIDELIEQTVPANIRLKQSLNLQAPQSEFDYLNN